MRYIIGVLLVLSGCASTRLETDALEPTVAAGQPIDETLTIGDALNAWAQQHRDFQIIIPQDCADSAPARRTSEPDAIGALDKLLIGTGLRYRFINARTVAIFCAAPQIAHGKAL